MFYGFHCTFSYGLGGWLNKSSLPLDGPLILGPPLEPRSRADNPKNTSFSERGGEGYGVGESRIFIFQYFSIFDIISTGRKYIEVFYRFIG